MQTYEDPQKHFAKHIDRAAKRYVDFQEAGFQPNETLTRAIAERTLTEAQEDYTQKATAILDSNIKAIIKNHNEGMNAIKREGASLRLKACPPIALVLLLVAWYNFSQGPRGIMVGMLYAFCALAFLAMLVLGAIFDRPSE